MLFKVFVSAIGVCLAFNAVAVTGIGTSSTTPLETMSPSLQSVLAVTEKRLSATFSEAMLTPDSTTPGNYIVSGLGVGTLVPSPTSVSGGPAVFTLDWASGEMRDGVSLTLTVSGMQDAVGNPINSAANNASCAGRGAAPVFSDLMVMPPKAGLGERVAITFSVSETLQADPEVTINGHPATAPYGKAETYLYEYEVQEDDPLGMAVIHISSADLAGNVGTLNNTSALEILEESEDLPLWGWPFAAALLLVLGLMLLWRRRLGGARVWTEWTKWTGGHHRRGMFFLFVALTLACSWAFAQAPTVSKVTMTQSPNATSTQVDIYYDLDAPNGPCAITVSLSKDGGADGYSYPVTSVTGDLAEVTTGTGKHIVWDIRADYPEEDLPQARILIVADDGAVQHTLTYLAGPGGSIDGQFSLQQTVNHGADGVQVTAVPDEGYGFLQWSDGVLTAARTDTNVTADISVMASFIQLPPEVTSFNLDGGAGTTLDLLVTLDNTATNNPAEYIVSEASDFAGAAWQA